MAVTKNDVLVSKEKEGHSFDLSGLITISSSSSKQYDAEGSQEMQVDSQSPREEKDSCSGSSNLTPKKAQP